MPKEKKLKEEPKKEATFEEFKELFMTKAWYRICPMICMKIGCPYVKECWELKKAKE